MKKRTNQIKAILFFVCNFMTTGLYSQDITYTITDADTGNIARIIAVAVDDANDVYHDPPEAKSVEILFEASKLISITQFLPAIYHSIGSITLRKSPNATTEQGFQFRASNLDATVMYGLWIDNSGYSKLSIQGLTFRDFTDAPDNGLYRSAIRITRGGEIEIKNCRFENASEAITMLDFQRIIEISNNIFTHHSQRSDVITYNGNYKMTDYDSMNVNIHDNLIKLDTGLYDSLGGNILGYGISIMLTKILGGEIRVERDTITNMGVGLGIFNQLGSDKDGNQWDSHARIHVRECDFTDNNMGMNIQRPLPYWEVEKNNFNNKITDGKVWLSYKNNAINFVEDGNVFGESTKNTGNDFTKTKSETSFYVHGNGAKMVGLNLNSHVCISDGSNAIVRDTRIRSNINIQKPIDRSGCDYKDFVTDIPTPIFNSAHLSGNILKVEFTLKELDPATGDFVMDFYKSNQRGDLTDYLGNLTVKDNGYFNQGFTIPAGISLEVGDTLAVTTTSLGNIGSNVMIGTSEAAYISLTISPLQPKPINCKDCIGSFSPVPGKKYFISAWVREENAPQVLANFNHPKISIECSETSGSKITLGPYMAKGQLIDGWQRVEEEFKIPDKTISMKLILASDSGNCFFDDIRIFPSGGTMKSYVYDPISLKLMAELDERNYATFYEYNEEGKLIRLKKETERGVMTVKEYRNNLKLK